MVRTSPFVDWGSRAMAAARVAANLFRKNAVRHAVSENESKRFKGLGFPIAANLFRDDTGRSDDEIRQIARKSLSTFGAPGTKCPVDVLSCLSNKTIWTIKGERPLHLHIRPDSDMGDDEGRTTFREDGIHIELKRSVYENARFGNGQSRNTCAHELGHAVLYHDKAPMARRILGNQTIRWIEPYRSAEHQVKVFAAAFLIKDGIAQGLPSPEEISAHCGVSLTSATIYFQQAEKERNRPLFAQQIQRKADEFRARHTKPASAVHFLSEQCPSCGARTIFPVGIKYMCQTCDRIFDGFQDGDSVNP